MTEQMNESNQNITLASAAELQQQENYQTDFDDEQLSIHHRVPMVLQTMDWDDLTDYIRDMDSGPMSEQCREEARREKQIILSIRHKLKRNNVILRGSYKGNNFNMYQAKAFQQKAANYMKRMGIYSLIRKLNGRNPEYITQNCLVNIVARVETTLDDLRSSKSLTELQYTAMNRGRTRVQLNYLYFVPETDKEGTPLRPIVVCNNGATMLISDYLCEFLWAMFDRVTHYNPFSQGADLVQALEMYAERGLLRPTTRFVTFTIDDVCTVFPHQQTLEALKHFLNTYASSDEEFHQQGMPIQTIIRLVRLVLENQFFVYDNKLYRQTAGGASGSPLTKPLAYIYLYHWQQALMNALIDNTQEIFGRYLDEGFLTWNGSENQLRLLFNMTANKHHHPSIRINTTIGSTVHFVDAYLSHDNGLLYTKVYRYPNTNENRLPDIPHIPTCPDSILLRAALIRAARCSSNVNDFNDEQNQIKLSYNFHELSTTFVEQQMQQFFTEFGTPSIVLSLSDPVDYNNLRHRVIESQQQMAELKKQRKIERKDKLIFKYQVDLGATEVALLKSILDDVSKEYFEHQSEGNDIKFEMVPICPIGLTSNDFLVDKRPPLRLLTLSESDKEEVSDDDDDD